MSPSEPSIVSQAQQSLDELAAKDVKTTDSEVRYMAYGSRLQTALRASHRYLAYVIVFLCFLQAPTKLPPRRATSVKPLGH
jgi:hypothetical protein